MSPQGRGGKRHLLKVKAIRHIIRSRIARVDRLKSKSDFAEFDDAHV